MKLPAWPLDPYPSALRVLTTAGPLQSPVNPGGVAARERPTPPTPPPTRRDCPPAPAPPLPGSGLGRGSGTGRGRPHLPTAQAWPVPALSPARTRTQRSALASDACTPPVRGESRSPAPQGGRPPPPLAAPGAPGALGSGPPAEAPGGARAWPLGRDASQGSPGGSRGSSLAGGPLAAGPRCGAGPVEDRAAVAWGRAGQPGWALSAPLTEKETEAGEGKRRTEGD